MSTELWFVAIGALLIFTVVARSVAERLSVSGAMLYLAMGMALGPAGAGVINPDLIEGAWMVERLTEIAVILSLFTAGLKLSLPLTDHRWRVPLRLAFGSMTLTVALIAIAGYLLLDLDPGAAILLGAILAPTDPVLASAVQVTHHEDRDRLRFGLTGEAGLNDGTAFPFVMLGLGLLGLHEIGELGWRWLVLDVLWATLAGFGIGALLGSLIGRLVIYLRIRHREAVGLDEFLALGLVALSYGAALLIQAYGFLAVFAAGLALRRIERKFAAAQPPPPIWKAAMHAGSFEVATDPKSAPAYLTETVLEFNLRAERIGEFIVMLLVGAVLLPHLATAAGWVLIALILLLIRPLAVWAVLLDGRLGDAPPRGLIAWFGIRGLGSVYYLSHAIQQGLPFELAEPLAAVVLSTVAVSVIVHGVSVPPLMRRYHSD